MDFKDQYKHPLWQKKRLEALDAAEYVCQGCFDSENQLHVHHKRYVKGRRLWEYDISELEVLCNGCHEIAHEQKDSLSLLLSRVESSGLSELVSLVAGYCAFASGPVRLDAHEAYTFLVPGQGRIGRFGAIAGLLSSIPDDESKAAFIAVHKAITENEESVTITLRAK